MSFYFVSKYKKQTSFPNTGGASCQDTPKGFNNAKCLQSSDILFDELLNYDKKTLVSRKAFSLPPTKNIIPNILISK